MVHEVGDDRQGEKCDGESNAQDEKRHLEKFLSALESSLAGSSATGIQIFCCRHDK